MSDYPFLNSPYAFTVCRIEPENNLHLILEAFEDSSALPVVAVGNWNNSDYGRDLRRHYHNSSVFFLLDPIYEPSRLNTIRGNCALYLHGHSCGGTNPSLVEAMFLGLPIIAYDVNFNRETTENQAWYFSSAAQLKTLCRELDDENQTMLGRKMKEIADRRYTWKRISECYSNLF
jgi:glycosyltransferase involved in cell wall biosynthesis